MCQGEGQQGETLMVVTMLMGDDETYEMVAVVHVPMGLMHLVHTHTHLHLT